MQLAGVPPSKYHGGGPCNCGHFSFLGHDLLPHATPLTCVPGPFPPRPGPALALFHPAPGLPALVHPALRLASVPGLLLPGPFPPARFALAPPRSHVPRPALPRPPVPRPSLPRPLSPSRVCASLPAPFPLTVPTVGNELPLSLRDYKYISFIIGV